MYSTFIQHVHQVINCQNDECREEQEYTVTRNKIYSNYFTLKIRRVKIKSETIHNKTTTKKTTKKERQRKEKN